MPAAAPDRNPRRPPSESSRPLLRRKRPRRLRIVAPPPPPPVAAAAADVVGAGDGGGTVRASAAAAATSSVEPEDYDGDGAFFEEESFDPESWMDDLLGSSGGAVPPRRPLPLLSTLGSGSGGGRGGRRGGDGGGGGGGFADPSEGSHDLSAKDDDGGAAAAAADAPLLRDFAEALKRTAAALRRRPGGEVRADGGRRGDDDGDDEIGSTTGVADGDVEALGGGGRDRDGDGPPAAAAAATGDAAAEEADASASDSNPLDDPRSSTLTLGQHARYKSLLAEIETNGKIADAQKRKELRKLRDAVREERKSYGAALDEFRMEHRERFAIGFKVRGPASGFVATNSKLVSRYKRAWLWDDSSELGGRDDDRPPTKYGQCVQTISLRGSSAACPTDSEGAIDSGNKLDIGSFSPKVVHSTGNVDSIPVAVRGWLDPETSVRLKPPGGNDSSRKGPTPGLLCDDGTARRLAAEHGASVVLTSDALEALLRRPGDPSTRWTIPLSSIAVATTGERKDDPKPTATARRGGGTSSVAFLEDPVPQPSTPRECLERGFLESLYKALSRPPPSSSEAAASHGDVQFVYTLLTIPPPESTPSSSSSEQKGVAHALAGVAASEGGDDASSGLERFVERFEPSARLRGAADLIRAAMTVGDGRHVLCLPGRGVPTGDPTTSVSVHKACDDAVVDGRCAAGSAGRSVGVDLESELGEADAVFLGPAVLEGCFRNWVWEADRVPYTFPVKEESVPIRRR